MGRGLEQTGEDGKAFLHLRGGGGEEIDPQGVGAGGEDQHSLGSGQGDHLAAGAGGGELQGQEEAAFGPEEPPPPLQAVRSRRVSAPARSRAVSFLSFVMWVASDRFCFGESSCFFS